MDILLSINRFDAALESKGWTLKNLADEYDRLYPSVKGKTVYNTLQKWHEGKGNPTLRIFTRICDLLECDIDYLSGRMDYHTHTSQFIHDQTGLSESSIDKLISLKERDEDFTELDVLNALLPLTSFDEVLTKLAIFYVNYKNYAAVWDDRETIEDFMGNEIKWNAVVQSSKYDISRSMEKFIDFFEAEAATKEGGKLSIPYPEKSDRKIRPDDPANDPE